MAARVRRLYGGSTPVNTHTAIYTVPAGKWCILRYLCQSIDNDAEGISGLIINGAGFVWDTRIPGTYHSRQWQLSTVLYAGDTVSANSNQSSNFHMLQGAELDIADAPQLFRHQQINLQSGAGAGWTPPVGKRARIRELVITPHAGTQNVNIYIAGVGYLFRGNVEAYEPQVLAVDVSINNGEYLHGVASGGTVHAWWSGVMEDA